MARSDCITEGEREGTYPVSPLVHRAGAGPGARGAALRHQAGRGAGQAGQQDRLDATIAEIHAQVALLTGGDPALAAQFARQATAATPGLWCGGSGCRWRKDWPGKCAAPCGS